VDLPQGFRTRFAPAPTGYLHLGHVVNAIHVWGLARAHAGTVLLRIEDHDRTRCRPEYEAALLDDLDWLGFVPDLGTTSELRRGPHPQRQSDNSPRYESALANLAEPGLVYNCRCSRKDITDPMGDVPNEETRYPGTCQLLHLPPGPDTVERVILAPGNEAFEDLRLGHQVQEPALQCGDMVVRDRNRNWTYQFAVTVDDMVQGIDVVIRGEDLLSSTGRQIALARLLGRAAPPRFLHHSLIRKSSGEKLSKSSGDTGIRDLRVAGWSAEAVLGRAAQLAGVTTGAQPLAQDGLSRLFTGRSGASGGQRITATD
jgi:glutamyl-tRNA synthetase/glutamyl-Q tRNA(Asp) synthetase